MVKRESNKSIQYKSILHTILIPYSGCMVLTLIIYFLLTGFLVVRHTKLMIENTANYTLEHISHISDTLLEYNFLYYCDFYGNEEVREYVNASVMMPGQYGEVTECLINCKKNDIITNSVYLYNEQLGMVFTSNGEAVPVENFYDKGIVEFFADGSGEDVVIPRNFKEKSGSDRKSVNVITYGFHGESISPGKRTALVVNIGQDRYQEIIGDKMEETSIITEVIDSDGSLVLGNNEIVAEEVPEDYIERILGSGEEKGTFDYRGKNGKYYISWQRSDFYEWIYITKADYSEMLSAFNSDNFAIIAVAVFFVLVSLFFSFLFSKRIYMPLHRLISRMNLNGIQKDRNHNEYEILNAVLKELEQNASRINNIEHRYRLRKQNEIMQKLLHGDIYWEKSESVLHDEQFLKEEAVYCVASFSFNHLDALKEIYSQTDMEVFCFSIINVLEEYLGNKGYIVYGVEDENNSVRAIIQLEEEYEKDSEYVMETFPKGNTTEIQKLLYGAKQEMESILKPITLFVSVGRSVDGPEELHRSWLDTKYANIYRFTRGTELITLFTEHMEIYESGIAYPIEIEKIFLSNLKMGKASEAMLNLDEFFLAIKKMAPDEMRWAINQIMTSVFRISMQRHYKMKDDSPLDWKAWVHKVNATDTRDEMREVLVQLLENLSIREGDIHSSKPQMAEDIKEYVEKNFCVGTLSVGEIASYVGVSVNYARQIFKDTYGMSISDFILEKRIEKAKELLRTTDYTSKRIAEMIGYSDNRYFYVVFKKKVGETAESFRKKKDN